MYDEEGSNELYNLTYEIINHFKNHIHPVGLVIHLTEDILNGHLDFMDDEDQYGLPSSTIRINVISSPTLTVERIKSLCGNAMPIDTYVEIANSVLDAKIEQVYSTALLYLNILLHELGHVHHGLKLHEAGRDINAMCNETVTMLKVYQPDLAIRYTLNPFELYADSYMYSKLKTAYELFGERLVKVLMDNLNRMR